MTDPIERLGWQNSDTLQPTMHLRWSTRYTPQSFEKVLQQKWASGTSEEWRPVPEVLDEANSIKPVKD